MVSLQYYNANYKTEVDVSLDVKPDHADPAAPRGSRHVSLKPARTILEPRAKWDDCHVTARPPNLEPPTYVWERRN